MDEIRANQVNPLVNPRNRASALASTVSQAPAQGVALPQESFSPQSVERGPVLTPSLLSKRVKIPALQALSGLGLAQGISAAVSAVPGPVGAATGRLTLDSLKALATRTELETKASYLESIEKATAAMARTGGIVDLPKGVPTLVLSDIHGRRDFITTALEREIDGTSVFDLLQQGKVNLVCLGDGMHSEDRGVERWQQAQNAHFQGNLASSPAMGEEMLENLGTMKMVMDLKSEFPKNFHFIRGNHDDSRGGFYKFCRTAEPAVVAAWIKEHFGEEFLQKNNQFQQTYAQAFQEGHVSKWIDENLHENFLDQYGDEQMPRAEKYAHAANDPRIVQVWMKGLMGEDFARQHAEVGRAHDALTGEANLVKSWVSERMGKDFLDRFAAFEDQMPLVVKGQGFVASHAAPAIPLTRDQIDSRDRKAFAALSWTENRGWREDDLELRKQFQGNLEELESPDSKWLVGHRNVDHGNYRGQLDNQLIQINDPTHFVMAMIPADGDFQPERDVWKLST